jgi:hypothetical protein
MNEQNRAPSQSRILRIQKTPQRAFHQLKVLGRVAGFTIFSAVFYLLYWKDSSIRQQYETIFWWLTLLFSAATFWWSESSRLRISTNLDSFDRTLHHLKTLGKIAGIVISSVIVDQFILKDNPFAGNFESYLQIFTLIFGAVAIWLLARDWFMTGNMTFIFDGDNESFRIQEGKRTQIQLSFQAIKRIKIEVSSNVFPIYILSLHLRDGQRLEIDASANQGEINGLADQISAMTGAQIVMQQYDEPLSKEEKEEQRTHWNDTYKGD